MKLLLIIGFSIVINGIQGMTGVDEIQDLINKIPITGKRIEIF